MRTLLETYVLLLESKKTEQEASIILKKADFSEEEINKIIENLKGIDSSENQQYLPMMATVLSWGMNDYDTIKEIFEDYNELLNNNNIGKISTSNGKIKILGKDNREDEFSNFIEFTEFIHGVRDNVYKKKYGYSYSEYKAEDKPLQSSNGIDVYEANSVGKCIKYSQGRLTGRGYSFCIGKPANKMYQSYRDTKDSTFYFIIDRNRFVTNDNGSVNLDNPLHIVVYDATRRGVELTDANNTTGTIAEFGTNVTAYQNYLKSKGINIDQLENQPKTPEEQAEQRMLGDKNESLKWFEQLSLDYKSKYIGRGHLLTDEQFNTIASNKELLNQYVNIGQVLPYSQFIVIKKIPSIFNSYMRARNIAVENDNDKLEIYELSDEQLADKIDISFANKGLTEIPDFVYKAKKLDFLSLGVNNISSIPEIFAETISPTSIDFSGNNLTSLPENFGNLKRLKTLYLNSNQLTTLPESIGDFENINVLFLSENQLTSLPESIGKLQTLQYLNLMSNQLTALPKSIKYLKNLSMMYLRDNPMSQEYVDRLRTLLPNCEIIFEYK
jgi:Leucine-rich repeat (LRR) protein